MQPIASLLTCPRHCVPLLAQAPHLSSAVSSLCSSSMALQALQLKYLALLYRHVKQQVGAHQRSALNWILSCLSPSFAGGQSMFCSLELWA